MIRRYNYITLFKSKTAPSSPNEKQPYYEMVANEKGSKDKVYPAKFWFKQSDSGVMYFSGEMNTPYTAQSGATYDGYTIVSIKDLDNLESQLTKLIKKPVIDEVIGRGYEGEVANPKDIPF